MSEVAPSIVADAAPSPAAVPDAPAPAVPAEGAGDVAPVTEAVTETPQAAVTEAAPEAPDALLGAFDEPAEPAKAEGEKPAEATEAPKPSYEKFTAPEGFDYTDEAHAEFAELLGAHGISQEGGQALFDRYTQEVGKVVENIRQQQHSVFGETVKAWQSEVKAGTLPNGEPNPYGGPRFETSVARANEVISKFGGTPDERRALGALLRFSGAGNHVTMMRLLNNVWQATQPPKIVAPSAPPKPDTSTRTGKVSALYSHPSNG